MLFYCFISSVSFCTYSIETLAPVATCSTDHTTGKKIQQQLALALFPTFLDAFFFEFILASPDFIT